MIVKIKNAWLGQAISLLFNLPLMAKKSRHRTKFVKLLNDRLQEVSEQEQQLLKEHCELDESGEPLKTDDGKGFKAKDTASFLKDQQELYDEELVIEGGDNREMLETVKDVLENCEEEFSGKEAMTYDYLYDQFENQKNEESGE